jgi:hypothetical protein
LLVHEAPTASLLLHQDSSKALEGFIRLHHILQTQGVEAANTTVEKFAFRVSDRVRLGLCAARGGRWRDITSDLSVALGALPGDLLEIIDVSKGRHRRASL